MNGERRIRQQSATILSGVSLVCVLGCFGNSVLGEPGEPASLVVQPERILFNSTTPRELILVTVLDRERRPVKWTPVHFESEDPSHAHFPHPQAFTNAEGIAANVMVRVVEPLTRVRTSFTVSSGVVETRPFPVRGQPAIADGWHGFVAPPLAPFDGRRQRLAGTIAPAFIPLPFGSNLTAWSIDPTIAEPGLGTITSEFPNVLEFNVTARKTGETVFIIGTTDLALYSAEITGDLAPTILRGDCNADGQVDMTDAIFLLNYNFLSGPQPLCLAACDANGDGRVTGMVTDAIYLLNFKFLGGRKPPAPFPECGPGTEKDVELGCDAPPQNCQSEFSLDAARLF